MGQSSFTSRRLWFFGMLIFTVLKSTAQFYNMGEDPGYLKWEQIRSDHFNVIYTKEFSDDAQRMAHLLESYYEPNSAYLGHRPGRIPVVLHNHSVLSNGFVSWAPKRMEVVTTPSSRSYSQDHLEQLALHEFRHVVQVDKLRQGFTKGLSYVIGQAGTGAVAGLMPRWFLEGDATDAETRLSYSGRGRQPFFEMEIKAILADTKGLFSYEKAIMGSFRDFVPDHYRLGYQIVSHARNKYGNELWDNVVNYTGRKPYSLYPFYFSLKKYAGISKTELYQETLETLRTHWTDQAEERVLTEKSNINGERNKHYTSYRFPGFINDSVIFAEKSGIDQIQEFVAIDRAGNEKRIYRPGFYDAANISVEQGKIVWAEILRDLRWARRSYSVIKIYDLETKIERILSLRTRYFAPDLSPDGNLIAAIEADERNHFFLVILGEKAGGVLEKIASPGNEYLQYPVWDDEMRAIYMTSLGENGKRIVRYGIETGEWKTVFHAGFEDIAELDCKGDYLVFRAGFSGIDNIYALELKSLQCQKITSSRFGAFTPCVSANVDTLIYSDYTSQGYDIVKTAFEPSKFIPLPAYFDHQEQLNRPTKEEETSVPLPGSPSKLYETKKYSKFGKLFNFHSWAPLYVDIDNPSIENLDVSPGLMLMSQNMLSTATTVLGYEYNLEKKDHFLHASFIYSGLFPVLKLSMDYGGLPYIASAPDSSLSLSKARTDMSVSTKVHLPLNFTYNRFIMGLQPSVEASYSRAYFYYTEPKGYRSGLTFMEYRLYFYDYLKTSKRDILPRVGLTLDLRYVDTPFEEEQIGSQIYGSGTLYIPGFLRHQTLRTFVGSQKQDPGNFLMSNLMSMPRGIFNHTAIELRKITFDYVFPIAYPDLKIWRAAYFKRVRGTFFYDYAVGKDVYIHGSSDGPVNQNFQSLGMELTCDVHIAQIFLPFNIGGRFIWIPDNDFPFPRTSGEFIFSVDLNQF